MYNDYYLEQINNKLQITNNRLNTIIENQETLISGDKIIDTDLQANTGILIAITMVLALTLTYTFITRCFRC